MTLRELHEIMRRLDPKAPARPVDEIADMEIGDLGVAGQVSLLTIMLHATCRSMGIPAHAAPGISYVAASEFTAIMFRNAPAPEDQEALVNSLNAAGVYATIEMLQDMEDGETVH